MISIILPYYNGKEFVREAIDSIMAQTYQWFELLVVDDGSPREEDQVFIRDLIVADNDPRIRCESRMNGGLSDARNYGVRHTAGEYVAFIDQDDAWEVSKLQKQMQVFLENPAVKLICTDGIFVGSKVGSMRVGKKRHLGASGTVNKTYRRMLKGNFVICSSVVFKRDLYDEVGSCDVRYSVVPDYEFFLRCAQVTNFYFIAEGLTKYRIHSANTSRSAMRGCTEVIDVLATAKMKDWRTRLAATYQFGRMLGRLLVLWFGRL